MHKSTAPRSRLKPHKPYPDFPLFAHANGLWAKKIRGQLRYFGSWADPQAALTKYLDQKDDLYAGRVPRAKESGGGTVRELADRFLDHKKTRLDDQELSARTFADYYQICQLVVRHFGPNRLLLDLGPPEFESLRVALPRTWGPRRRGKAIAIVRCLFRFADDYDLVPHAVKVGKGFRGPSKKVLRLHRAKQGKKLFEPAEIHRMLAEATVLLRAAILLGLNFGYGNTDVATLPLAAIDLTNAWIVFARPKTGAERKGKVWPETLVALQEAIAQRPAAAAPEYAGLALLTRHGGPLVKVTCQPQEGNKLRVVCHDALGKATKKLLARLGINGNRCFYTCRHTFRTWADSCGDQPAANFIMGHIDNSTADAYREMIDDDRLEAVANHVREKLFGGITQN
jgi:integrase